MSVSKQAVFDLLKRGTSLERAGEFGEAYQTYRRVLKSDRKCVEALSQLGVLELRAGNLVQAIRFFEAAVRAAPRNPAVRNNLAKAFMMQGRPDKALPHLAEAFSRAPKSAQILRNLGECQRSLGNQSDSIRFYEAALGLDHLDDTTLIELARTYQAAGDRERAEPIYRDLIARGGQLAEAWSGLSRIRTWCGEAPELAEIESAVRSAEETMHPFEKRLLYFARGKLLDDLGRYDAAFDSFRKANALAPRMYEPTSTEGILQEIQSVFDAEFFTRRADLGSPTDRPVFIFGMPRSGTTLVEQILAAHPNVCGAGELYYFRELGAKGQQAEGERRGSYENIDRLGLRDARRHVREYLNLLTFYSAESDRVTDKMPQNFLRLGWMALLFPNASFVHCVRDPMDTCVSCYVNTLSRNHTYASELVALGHYYRHYRAVMAHWKRVLPVKILEVRYEDVVCEPEEWSRRLVDHVGLDWDDACLNFNESSRIVRTLSAWQVRQPIYSTAIGHWKRFDKHLGPLKEALGDLFRESANGSQS